MTGAIGSPCSTANYVSYRTPWGLTVTINKALLPRFKAACEEASKNPWKPQRIDSYNCRQIRGSSSWSRHAYAAAFDFFNKPYPEPVDVWGPTNSPTQSFAAVFKKYGFTWGGEWTGRPDYPHIEWSGPIVPELEGDWLSMATKDELRDVVREEIVKEMDRQRRLLAVGKDEPYNRDNVNLKVLLNKLK